MRFRQLQYFIKVVELGGITRAAESLHIAQPALSQQIANLEADLGTQLLIRTSKGTTPTESGRILYRHGYQILGQLESARSEIHSSKENPAGHVSIGLPGSIAKIAAVPILKEIRERLPNVIPEIIEGYNDLLFEMLFNGRVDIAFLYHYDTLTGVKIEPLLHEKLFLAFARDADFHVPDTQSVSLEELSSIPLILPSSDTPKRKMIEASLRAKELPVSVVVETTALTTTVAAARSGLGAAILPWSGVFDEVKNDSLKIIPIKDNCFSRPISLCISEGNPLDIAAIEVLQVIREVIYQLVRDGDWREVSLLSDAAILSR
jgi:LysR family transcriptional regulator, nitrogen assimilation regulatory protein